MKLFFRFSSWTGEESSACFSWLHSQASKHPLISREALRTLESRLAIHQPRSAMDVPKEDYARILKEIESDASPVGIDAKHTHILILHLLAEIDRRLTRIEQELNVGNRYNV